MDEIIAIKKKIISQRCDRNGVPEIYLLPDGELEWKDPGIHLYRKINRWPRMPIKCIRSKFERIKAWNE